MRILVTSIVDLERTAHNRCQEFVKHLSRNHEVTVLSIQDWWKAEQVGEEVYRDGFEEVADRIETIPYTSAEVAPIVQEIIALKTAKGLLSDLEHLPDIHLDYNTLLSGARFGRLLSREGIPTVYDLADDLVAMVKDSPQIPGVLSPLAGAAAKIAFRRNVKNARYVTVINQTLADSEDIPESKVRVVPNGVDTELFKPTKSDLASALDLEGKLVIGYVGVLREWVDFGPVLDAIAILRDTAAFDTDVRLVIVGEEGEREKIERRAKKVGVEDTLVFTGTVPYTQVPEYISTFDVGLIPFDASEISANSLPLKLFEYMACKVPVISSPLPGVKECAEDRIMYASTAKEYADHLESLSSRDHSKEAAGRTWVREDYSWQGVSEKLEDILLEVASSG